MGQPISRSYMCCSIRDKYGHGDSLVPATDIAAFEVLESEVHLEAPIFTAFAPIHHKESSLTRRIAIASQTEVQIYRVSDPSLQPLHFELTHKLRMTDKRIIAGIIFPDETSARQVAIAFGPASTATKGHVVRLWSCTIQSPPSGPDEDTSNKVEEWNPDEGFIESVEEHNAHIGCMAVSKSYLVTADDVGECRVWAKGRSWVRAAAQCIHQDGVADLTADRLYTYSIGKKELKVCVWALPGLTQVLSIPVAFDVQTSLQSSSKDDGRRYSQAREPVSALNGTSKGGDLSNKVLRLTHLRRPLSRWAGWQGSSRGPKVPRGLLFLAGVLEEPLGEGGGGDSGPGEHVGGSGVLLEYSLGANPTCRSVQLAHDAPISCLMYGPYDNGPVITADERGIFRVWDLLLENGPHFSQQIELQRVRAPGQFAVCVEQPEGVYVAASGGRLLLWRRQKDLETPP